MYLQKLNKPSLANSQKDSFLNNFDIYKTVGGGIRIETYVVKDTETRDIFIQ